MGVNVVLYKATIVCDVCGKAITTDPKPILDARFNVRRFYHAHLQTHGYTNSDAQLEAATRDPSLEQVSSNL